MTSSQIEVIYDLFEKVSSSPPRFRPVATAGDRALQTELRSSDSLPLVDSYGDVDQQTIALDKHVKDVPYEFPVLNHLIAFDHMTPTKWDSNAGTWVRVVLGGALSYAVVVEGGDPDDARLFLAARTSNAAI